MKITRIGLDLAKNIFQVHAMVNDGTVLRKVIKRKDVLKFFAKLNREDHCTVGMEACSGSHYWAREIKKLDYDVKIMPAHYVKPYRQGNKNDRNDAEAICEAVGSSRMRCVPIHTLQQQELLTTHRFRERLIKQRSMLINQTRGLLAEYGIIIPKNTSQFSRALPLIIEDASNVLGVKSRQILSDVYDEFSLLNKRLDAVDKDIEQEAKNNEACRRLMEVEGIGPLTATATVATLGDCSQFKRGRQVSHWMGIVPNEHSSGGKIKLGGISCRGNAYLRTLFVHGARSALRVASDKSSERIRKVKSMTERMHQNKAVVALANKNVRLVFAILRDGSKYKKVA